MKTIHERITGRTVNVNGCWIFQGAKTSRGYGSIRIDGASRSTHVVMYELHIGTIPDGMEIDHRCRVRACCNPAHLEAVTPLVNWERGESPSRLNALKTHCTVGHALDDSRRCVTCQRDRNRTHMRKGRENRGYEFKLNDGQAAEVRALHAAGGMTQRELAHQFGVSPTLVSLIVNGKRHAA
jgi:Helix-turn-helix.